MSTSRVSYTLLRTSDVYEAAVEKLIQDNREKLIKECVANEEVRDKLLQINKLMGEIERIDPGTVAAWGGGCGHHCAVDVPGEIEYLNALR